MPFARVMRITALPIRFSGLSGEVVPGRETIARVAAGAIARKMLLELGVSVRAKVIELAGISLTEDRQKAELWRSRRSIFRGTGGFCRRSGGMSGGRPSCRYRGTGFDKLDASWQRP